MAVCIGYVPVLGQNNLSAMDWMPASLDWENQKWTYIAGGAAVVLIFGALMVKKKKRRRAASSASSASPASAPASSGSRSLSVQYQG